jgi:NTP pyrophosphatase (non-canonical NTP hydrolase)
VIQIKNKMPNLVKGHIRYTEEDFLYSDLNQKIVDYITTGEEKETPIESIVDILHEELEELSTVTVNYKHLTHLTDDVDDVKQKAGLVLAETLEYFLTLARKCGFTLEELIKYTF